MTQAVSIAQSGSNNTTFRNRIINGAMGISQRGTSFTSVGNSGSVPAYTLDRWFGFRGAYAANLDVTQQAGFSGYQYCLRMQRTSGSTNATNGLQLNQIIETLNCYDLAGQTVTVSMSVRAGANYSGGSTANLQVSCSATANATSAGLANGTAGFSVAGTTSFTPSTTASVVTTTVSVPAGTQTIVVQVYYAPTGTAGSADYIEFTGVQLEKGTAATPFEQRLYGTELALCQRYFQLLQNSYGTSLAPASIARCTWPLKVTMRANMTIAVVGSPTWFYGGGTATYSSLGTNYSIPEMAQVDLNVTGGSAASGTMCSSASGGSSYFTASAEL